MSEGLATFVMEVLSGKKVVATIRSAINMKLGRYMDHEGGRESFIKLIIVPI